MFVMFVKACQTLTVKIRIGRVLSQRRLLRHASSRRCCRPGCNQPRGQHRQHITRLWERRSGWTAQVRSPRQDRAPLRRIGCCSQRISISIALSQCSLFHPQTQMSLQTRWLELFCSRSVPVLSFDFSVELLEMEYSEYSSLWKMVHMFVICI